MKEGENKRDKSIDFRTFVTPEFGGEVKKGREYIIVDDHITSGTTLNMLRDYIEKNGGKVVFVTGLSASHDATTIAPTKNTLYELRKKHPNIDQVLRELGVANRAEGLTDRQAIHFKALSIDEIRNRAIKERQKGNLGIHQETNQGVESRGENQLVENSDDHTPFSISEEESAPVAVALQGVSRAVQSGVSSVGKAQGIAKERGIKVGLNNLADALERTSEAVELLGDV